MGDSTTTLAKIGSVDLGPERARSCAGRTTLIGSFFNCTGCVKVEAVE
jgi:hypothetical protein